MMTQTATRKIKATGFVLRMKRDDNLGVAETWMVSDERGYPARVGAKSLSAQECAGLVEAGALVVHHEIEATGAIIYRLVTP